MNLLSLLLNEGHICLQGGLLLHLVLLVSDSTGYVDLVVLLFALYLLVDVYFESLLKFLRQFMRYGDLLYDLLYVVVFSNLQLDVLFFELEVDYKERLGLCLHIAYPSVVAWGVVIELILIVMNCIFHLLFHLLQNFQLLFVFSLVSTFLLLPTVVNCLRQNLVWAMKAAFTRASPFNSIILAKTLAKVLIPAIIILTSLIIGLVHVWMPTLPLLIASFGVLVIRIELIRETLLLVISTTMTFAALIGLASFCLELVVRILALFFPVIVGVTIFLFVEALASFEVTLRLIAFSWVRLLLRLLLLLLILRLSDLCLFFRTTGEVLGVFLLWVTLMLLFLLHD